MRLRLMVVFAVALLALPVFGEWDLNGFEWVVVVDGDSMAVATNDWSHRRVERLRGEYDEPFIWVRREGSEWIITDGSTVRKLHELMKEPRDLSEVHRRMEEETRSIEESMRAFEQRVAEIESGLEDGSLAAALEVAEAAKEIGTAKMEAAAERMKESARHLERWVEELEDRIEEEAVPLIEDAIRTGKAKRLK